jgi:hypothetical protein
MDTAGWEVEFSEARQLLLECGDFRVLREHRHELRDGVVLTSVSDIPFEMSFKCVRCGGTFWFENTTWETGGIPQWRINDQSRAGTFLCAP